MLEKDNSKQTVINDYLEGISFEMVDKQGNISKEENEPARAYTKYLKEMVGEKKATSLINNAISEQKIKNSKNYLDFLSAAPESAKLAKEFKKLQERRGYTSGGLLQDDKKRIGYAIGTPETPVDTRKETARALMGLDISQEEINVLKTKPLDSKEVRAIINRTEKNFEVEPGVLFNDIASLRPVKKEDRTPKMYGGKMEYNKGGSLLADDMPMMEEEQETHMMPDGTEMPGATHEETLEPDSEMEDGYLDYILGEALSTEEEDILMSKLEQDGELSVLFDKVVGVAQEFAGSGPVEGPGSGVSDSIPARLSDGEFVFTAKAVEEIGADNLKAMMDEAEMKAGERQGFAEGDVVEEDNVTMPVEKQPMKQDIRVTKETVGAQAGMLEQNDLVDDEVKKSMFRQNRFLG